MSLLNRKGLGAFAGSMIPLGLEPQVASRFLFEVEGVEIGVFKEVTGLGMTVDPVSLIEGGQNGFVHKLPNRMTWSNIVFKRGLMHGDALFDWVSETSGSGFAGKDNSLDRQWAAITAIDSWGIPLRDWTLRDAFPVRWKGPDFSIENRNALDEELEITHHGFTSKTYTPLP